MYVSSGTEDFHLSSYNWNQTTAYGADNSGLTYISNTGGVTGGSTVDVYRVFGEEGGAVPCSPTPRQNFLLTWTSGDPQVGQSGVVTMTGHVWYYV